MSMSEILKRIEALLMESIGHDCMNLPREFSFFFFSNIIIIISMQNNDKKILQGYFVSFFSCGFCFHLKKPISFIFLIIHITLR